MIYHVPDDPELGYLTEEEVEPCPSGDGMCFIGDDCDNYFKVEEADCSLCGADIPQDATVPLCATCELTCRAHGKQMADAARYPDPEHS